MSQCLVESCLRQDWLERSGEDLILSEAGRVRDEVLAAKERVMRAIEAVGPELTGVLIDICCELKGLEDAEKSHGWPQRAGTKRWELRRNSLFAVHS